METVETVETVETAETVETVGAVTPAAAAGAPKVTAAAGMGAGVMANCGCENPTTVALGKCSVHPLIRCEREWPRAN